MLKGTKNILATAKNNTLSLWHFLLNSHSLFCCLFLRENEALWTELSDLRQKHAQQQQVIKEVRSTCAHQFCNHCNRPFSHDVTQLPFWCEAVYSYFRRHSGILAPLEWSTLSIQFEDDCSRILIIYIQGKAFGRSQNNLPISVICRLKLGEELKMEHWSHTLSASCSHSYTVFSVFITNELIICICQINWRFRRLHVGTERLIFQYFMYCLIQCLYVLE